MQVAVSKVPTKKKSKAGWVILTLFLVFIVGPIALVYALFYDPTSKRVELQENFTFENVANRLIVDSLDYAPTEEMIDIKVTENDVDNLLYLAMKSVTEKTPYVKKAYVTVRGNKYYFYIDLDGVIIKSRARISTELQIADDNEHFIFKIKDVALGRVSGILSPAKGLIERFITYDKIDQILANTQTDLTFDREQYALVYPKSSLIKDLGRLTNNSAVGLYFDVMQTMVHDNLMEFKFRDNNVIEGIVDLSKLETNDLVTDTAEQIRISSEEVQHIRDDLVYLIENGTIDVANKDLPFYAFDFMFGGWESLNGAAQAALQDIDFTLVGIPNKETYEGFGLYDAEAKLIDKMKDTVDVEKLIDKNLTPRYRDLCTLSEDVINEYISGRNIVGHTSLLHRDTPEGYKVNYITIENFYMNIYKDSDNKNIAEMVCKIDVNGYVTSLTFATEMSTGEFDGSKLVFSVKDIQFGQSNADNLKEEFFDIIYDALNNEGDHSLQADKENYTISVDFADIMEYALQEAENAVEIGTGTHYDLSSYFEMSNISFEIIGDDRNDEGAMKLSLNNPVDY